MNCCRCGSKIKYEEIEQRYHFYCPNCGFSTKWRRLCFVLPEADEAYGEAMSQALKAYDNERDRLFEDYEEAIVPAQRLCEKAIAPYKKAHDDAMDEASKRYNKAIDEARKKYNKKISRAQKESEEAEG